MVPESHVELFRQGMKKCIDTAKVTLEWVSWHTF